MKILVDTNVLFSALLFKGSKPAKALFHASEHHDIYLTDQNVYELKEVIKRKMPDRLPAIETFLAKLDYEIIPAAHKTKHTIRDATDQPILNAAAENDLDVIITGDKDLDLKRPRCVSVAEFCEMEDIR